MVISFKDYERHGCPYCNHLRCYTMMSGRNTSVVRCGNKNCDKGYHIVGNGALHGDFGQSDDTGALIYPRVEKHHPKPLPAIG